MHNARSLKIFLKTCLFIWKAELERKRSFICWLFRWLQWPRLGHLDAWSFFQAAHRGGRGRRRLFFCFPRPLILSWIGSREVRTQTSACMGCRSPRHYSPLCYNVGPTVWSFKMLFWLLLLLTCFGSEKKTHYFSFLALCILWPSFFDDFEPQLLLPHFYALLLCLRYYCK